MKLQTRLRKLRIQHKMTQEDAAKQLNVSRKTISSWENGRSIPDNEILKKITHLYGYPLNNLDDILQPSLNNHQFIKSVNDRNPKLKKYWLIILLTCNAIIFVMSMMNFINNDFAGVGFLQLIVDAFSLIYLNPALIQVIKEDKIIILISTIWFTIFVYLFVVKSYVSGHSRWPIGLVTLKSMFVTIFFTYVFTILITSQRLYQKIIK